MAAGNLVEALERAHTYFQVASSGLKNDRLEEGGSLGAWSVRESLVVLHAWLGAYLDTARALSRRESPSRAGASLASLEAQARFHTAAIDATRELAVGEIFLRLEQQHHEALALARRLSASALATSGSWPWGGEGSVEAVLQRAASHKMEAAHCIRDWRTRHHW